MTVDRELGQGPNGTVYLVTRRMDMRKLALKHIAIPASDAQTKALIYAGAVKDEAGAQRYYNTQVQEIKDQLLLLNGIQNGDNLLKYRGYQVDQKIVGVGFDVYLLSDYFRPLPEYLSSHSLTRVEAISLGLDLCSALEQLRSGGLIHKDIRPSNIYYGDSRHFLLGDLGVVRSEDLRYSTMPDQMITEYTAPEVIPEDAPLSDTMDIYSVGMILYEIYNGCRFPVEEGETFVRTREDLPAPEYADMTLTEIILKACAYNPADRYQTPGEMKDALSLYFSRTSISGDPLIPGNEDTEVDVSAIAATVEAGQAAAAGIEPEAEPATVPEQEKPEETPEPVLPEPEPEPVVPKVSLNDLKEDQLLMPTEREISVEDFLASIRSTPGLEVVSMDADGNTSVVPGYETEETLPEDTEYVTSADVHAPAYVPPEYDSGEDAAPVSDSFRETFGLPEEPTAAPAYEEEDAPYTPEPCDDEPYVSPAVKRDKATEYDDGYDEEEEDFGDEERSGGWKGVLVAIIILLALAGGAFALYTFKTDTIEGMRSEVLSSSSVEITADTKNGTGMDVVCSTVSGEVSRQPLVDGVATFTDLSPSSTYTFTLRSSEGMLLLGSKSVEARTAQMTNLTNFTASSISAVSANFSVAGTGSQPDEWIITCEAENGQQITTTTSDVSAPVPVEGLTPATAYTATISRGDGDQLSGTTTCQFTTMNYTELSYFEAISVSTDSMTLQWNYTGTKPETWSVTCTGDDGTSTTQEVGGTECTLDGLTAGVNYTLSLGCISLKPTDLSTISVTIPTVTITEISSSQNEDGDIEVSWSYTGDMEPASWTVTCSYETAEGESPVSLTTETNSLTLSDPIPNVTYRFTVTNADEFRVGGMAETQCATGSAPDFDAYGVSDVELSLYVLEDESDEPADTFTTGQHIAFAVQASYDATEEDKNVKTLYVIRDSSGLPVYVYRNDDPGRSWSGSWTTARHTGDLPDMPQEPGEYTLEIYFDGGLLAEERFTVIDG